MAHSSRRTSQVVLFYIFQDFSKFLDDNFDVKEWVNGAFRTQKDSPEQKDVSMYISTK